MIRKFLICGKQIFISSKKLDDQGTGDEKTPICELLLPINAYWDIEKLLKRIDYMVASNEDPVVINDLTQTVLRKCVKYTVFEKDRVLLHDKLRGV